jgi:LysR family transcriptional regulator, low CO2-responsive transcriptional regulator
MPIDHRITLQKLEVFELVVELQSVSRAADQLYTAQPVISAHLRSLEARLGARLFYREGRQLQLTEAGHAAHAWAADVLTRTRELGRHLEGLRDGQGGAVSLAASMSVGSYMLPPVLNQFRQERPMVEIELSVIDTDHAVRAVEVGECDFAVVYGQGPPDVEGLTGDQIGLEPLVLVAPSDDQLVGRGEITPDALARLPFVESPKGMLRRTLTDRMLQRAGVPSRRITIQLGHPEAMKRAVRDGLGIALLFRSSVEQELEDGTLRELRLPDAEFYSPIYLIHRKGKLFSASQQDLLEAIRADISARWPWV